ncbi:hypothetical protein [Bacillus sp. FSL W8-0848]|uniref:hypothetical protein n=1 Tax=Bacillus sp. FSL W8-0848 TaxID=2954634 RepID=UPI0030F6C074
MFELNLAHTSILELLEKAAEKNELIYVRARQRRVGKTTALLEFARKNNYPVLAKREVARSYQRRYPDLNIIGYVDGSELDGLYNVVCDEGIPKDAVKRLHKRGILLTGFILENVYENIGVDQGVSLGYSAPSKKTTPLLQIELEDIDSVPRIFYKGKQIDSIINADFSYLTNDDSTINPTHIDIEYMDKESKFGTKAIVYNRHFHDQRERS